MKQQIPVRSADEILKGGLIRGQIVWFACTNCGGTGNYPSSMIPAGKCRNYCWRRSDPELYGKMPYDIDDYVTREQNRDRRNYRAAQKQKQREAIIAARESSPDPRIVKVLTALNIPIPIPQSLYEQCNTYGSKVSFSVSRAVSIADQWFCRGELSDKQWNFFESLPTIYEKEKTRQAAYEAARAASQHVGTIGDRVELTVTLKKVSSFEPYNRWRHCYETKCVVRALDGANVITWFTGWSPVKLNDEGKPETSDAQLHIRGTVKKHTDYKGEKQTILSRVKVME